jgi:hypothetical protein
MEEEPATNLLLDITRNNIPSSFESTLASHKNDIRSLQLSMSGSVTTDYNFFFQLLRSLKRLESFSFASSSCMYKRPGRMYGSSRDYRGRTKSSGWRYLGGSPMQEGGHCNYFENQFILLHVGRQGGRRGNKRNA